MFTSIVIKDKVTMYILGLFMWVALFLLLSPEGTFPTQVDALFMEVTYLDKLCHILLLIALTVLVNKAVKISTAVFTVSVFIFIVGTEMLQGLTGRTPSLFDALADLTGVFIGGGLWFSWLLMKTSKKKHPE